MTISLAFLAPGLVKAAVEGRLPHGIGVARLFDAPVGWAHQHQMLRLAHSQAAHGEDGSARDTQQRRERHRPDPPICAAAREHRPRRAVLMRELR
jgi:hypothetical protein